MLKVLCSIVFIQLMIYCVCFLVPGILLVIVSYKFILFCILILQVTVYQYYIICLCLLSTI